MRDGRSNTCFEVARRTSDRADADALGLDTGHTTDTLLGVMPSATDKARRDAPSIAVYEL